MVELTNIVERELLDKQDEALSLTEKVGWTLLEISASTTLPYAARLVNDELLHHSLNLPKIIETVSYHAGDFAHIWGPYWLAGLIEGKKSRKYSTIILGLTTAYHTLGEIFHSSIAPDLPQILPGTPDPKDIPVALLCAVGLYLMNREKVRY